MAELSQVRLLLQQRGMLRSLRARLSAAAWMRVSVMTTAGQRLALAPRVLRCATPRTPTAVHAALFVSGRRLLPPRLHPDATGAFSVGLDVLAGCASAVFFQ